MDQIIYSGDEFRHVNTSLNMSKFSTHADAEGW